MYETIERIEENSELIIESLPNPYTAYTGSTRVNSEEYKADVNIDKAFRISNLTTYTVKLAFWTGGEGGGTIEYTITKE